MWKWLHPYAKHETQYHLCGKLSPFFGAIAVLLLAVGIVWGLAYAPADYQQGNSFRIMYVHVPAAIWSMGVYGSMAIAAIYCIRFGKLKQHTFRWLPWHQLVRCLPLSRWSLAQFGVNQCGEPGGCGMRV